MKYSISFTLLMGLSFAIYLFNFSNAFDTGRSWDLSWKIFATNKFKKTVPENI